MKLPKKPFNMTGSPFAKSMPMDKEDMMDHGVDESTEKQPKKKVMSKGQAAKKARSGADMGKPGKNFSKIAKKAGKEYRSVAIGKKVAGSVFQKLRKAGKL